MLATSRGAERPRTLRRLNTPRQVEVRADADGIPGALLHNSRWLRVDAMLDRYRPDDLLWTAEPVSPAYYELLLEAGQPTAETVCERISNLRNLLFHSIDIIPHMRLFRLPVFILRSYKPPEC